MTSRDRAASADQVELPIAGRDVGRVGISRFPPFLRLEFWEATDDGPGPRPNYTLGIEGSAVMTAAGKDVTIDPPAGPAQAYLDLVFKTVARAVAFHDGTLVIDFADGDRITVGPDRYEPWQLGGDDGTLIVSVAGGGLAIWGATVEKD